MWGLMGIKLPKINLKKLLGILSTIVAILEMLTKRSE